MVCLDTDIIIDFLRGNKEAIKQIKELKENSESISTTSINSFELFKGALRSKQTGASENLTGFLNNLDILYFDFEASKEAAKIFEDLRVSGEMIDPLDLLIASIVITKKEKLLTRNVKHFKRISNLNLLEL